MIQLIMPPPAPHHVRSYGPSAGLNKLLPGFGYDERMLPTAPTYDGLLLFSLYGSSSAGQPYRSDDILVYRQRHAQAVLCLHMQRTFWAWYTVSNVLTGPAHIAEIEVQTGTGDKRLTSYQVETSTWNDWWGHNGKAEEIRNAKRLVPCTMYSSSAENKTLCM
jgi:hypothetical protein